MFPFIQTVWIYIWNIPVGRCFVQLSSGYCICWVYSSDSSVSLCNYDGLEVSIWVFGSPVTLVGTSTQRLSLPGGASVSLAWDSEERLELIPVVCSSLTNLIPLLRNPSVLVPEFPGGGRDRHAVSPPSLSCSQTIVSLCAFSCLRDSSSPQTHFSRPLSFCLNWDLL